LIVGEDSIIESKPTIEILQVSYFIAHLTL